MSRRAARLIGASSGSCEAVRSICAAAAVDRVYGFKDRAVDRDRLPAPGPADAAACAPGCRRRAAPCGNRRSPGRAVPHSQGDALCAGRVGGGSRATALAAGARSQAKPSEPLETVLAAAIEAEESLEDLQETAAKENDPKLKELVQKLSETIQEMKQPGVDTKEALAKLSEMQAAITAQQAQFNVGLVDAQMQALGEAMASTQALEGAGKALQQGKYDMAAEQLEKAEPKFDRKETKTLKDKLAKAAKSMEDAGLAELSTATTELSESMEDAATAAGACKKLGNLAKSQCASQEDQRPAWPFSAGISASARATATRTAPPSCGCGRSPTNRPATGAWASAVTPTAR